MKYAKPHLGARAARSTAVAASAIILLLATSCKKDNVGRLLQERAALQSKRDSVVRAYSLKEDQIKREIARGDSFPVPSPDWYYKLERRQEELQQEREGKVAPIENKIDSTNREFRKYDAFGRLLRD